ncbi:MAG: hypothetical protein M1828_004549 [Chrysothrix sp. TS-e1954]|nr:MAG: hypothetical protein M1828_004549 [Chrysothrix sp. TS-e1954]
MTPVFHRHQNTTMHLPTYNFDYKPKRQPTPLTSIGRGTSPRRKRLIAARIIGICILLYFIRTFTTQPTLLLRRLGSLLNNSPDPNRRTLIVASRPGDDTAWVSGTVPSWEKKVYGTHDLRSDLVDQRRKGKGGEAAVYLTYLIENYHALPKTMVFVPGERYQPHPIAGNQDTAHLLSTLNPTHIHTQGYTSLHCTFGHGCPALLHPRHDPSFKSGEDYDLVSQEAAHAAFYRVFLPERVIPQVAGANQGGGGGGGQFAVSREAARKRAREEYVAMRQWAWEAGLSEKVVGRVFGGLWPGE